jgi:hypothetical protein
MTKSDTLVRIGTKTVPHDGDPGLDRLNGGSFTAPANVPAGLGLAGGPGFDGGTGLGSVTRAGYDCRDLWFDMPNTTNDNHIYDCWEKWKGDSNNWAYNRYTLFDPANGQNGWRNEIVDATIRFHPWAGSTSVTGGPYNYAPQPSSSCTTYTASLPFPAGLGSLSVPLVSCGASISVLPNGTKHEFGTDWNGRRAMPGAGRQLPVARAAPCCSSSRPSMHHARRFLAQQSRTHGP